MPTGQWVAGNDSIDASVLYDVARGTASETGENFFKQLCRHLASATRCRWAAATEYVPERRALRTLAFWDRDKFWDNFEYPLAHTPCEVVIGGNYCHFPERVAQAFPQHHELVEFGIDSYMGVPLVDQAGLCLGHLYIMDDKPMPPEPTALCVFRVFAARAAAELNRTRAAEALRASQARFEHLTEAAPSLVFEADPHGRVVYVSQRWRSVLGLAGGDALGDGWLSIIPPDHREHAAASWRAAIDAGQPWEHELPIRLADGSEGWVLARALPQITPSGAVASYIGTATDISAVKQAQRAAQESQERFRAVVDAAMDAVIAFDQAGRISVFNAAAEHVFHMPRQQAIGTSLVRLLSRPLGEIIESYIARAGVDAAPPNEVLPPDQTARRADSTFRVEGNLALVRHADHVLFTLTLRDVEERERARSKIETLTRENQYLKEQASASLREDPIIGSSKALKRVLADVELVAPTDSIVLIQGETGTGKELIAQAIHRRSERRDGPFVKVNCAALPASLVESEFFGHEKGAFTGAVAQRRGRFELADRGTIFLDEVGEVSPEVQVKLLRVLQEHEFERVGGSRTIRVDTRVIAATNRDLAKDVESGAFRADLYYRLCVFPITTPPLRDRNEDVVLLAEHFARQIAKTLGKAVEGLDADTADRIRRYPWPGNIRELRNVIERAVILCNAPLLRIDPAALRAAPHHAAGPGSATQSARTLEDVERDHILAVLERTDGAIAGPAGAAVVLGIPPSTLRSRMQKLGIVARTKSN
ncbi:MAG: sigma 54-interacting transcriptional regulator [Phycisphaerales bacterium]|nr:sigma 54-interacting transcriptional regulator [Phycisphaerales bacterium]